MIKKSDLLVLLSLTLTLLSTVVLAGDNPATAELEQNYLDSSACQNCHQEEFDRWQGSHHDWAMKEADKTSVLGNFNDSEFRYNGITTRFSTAAGNNGEPTYWVTTDNHQGTLETFRVEYTFGFYPLQQYLIGFPDGRYQALAIAWDSRPIEEGGQRWFHLYPDEIVDHKDPLHWTGLYFNWNNRCADCHSTNLQKNYDPATNTYQTRWSEINVGCEACHGPGKDHIAWANNPSNKFNSANQGFARDLMAISIGKVLAASKGLTKPVDLNVSQAQMATCGSCHSRRTVIDDINAPGNYHDKHQLSLLDEPLYHIDGQIKDEVYVLGSFLQSKMYQKGVVCSHCHDPHSMEPKLPGNQLCTQCHESQIYDDKTHHHHPISSAGSQCVNCHMPETTYMMVDPRRDHSLRIPRPDLSAVTGAPNACTQCHKDQSDSWATEALTSWLEKSNKSLPAHYGAQLAKLDLYSNTLASDLTKIIESGLPPIVRASSLSKLVNNGSPESIALARRQLTDNDPSVRATAVKVLAQLPYPQRLKTLIDTITDKSKLVRLATVHALIDAPLLSSKAGLTSNQKRSLNGALEEYRAALTLNQDSASGQLRLAHYYQYTGSINGAETAYIRALKIEPYNIMAKLNQADFYRQQGSQKKSLQLLQATAIEHPKEPSVLHVLGLALVRTGEYTKALEQLQKAATLAPDNFRYGYVYTVALHNTGDYLAALTESNKLLKAQPNHQEVLSLALDASLKTENLSSGLKFTKQLLALNPQDPTLIRLKRQLENALGR